MYLQKYTPLGTHDLLMADFFPFLIVKNKVAKYDVTVYFKGIFCHLNFRSRRAAAFSTPRMDSPMPVIPHQKVHTPTTTINKWIN